MWLESGQLDLGLLFSRLLLLVSFLRSILSALNFLKAGVHWALWPTLLPLLRGIPSPGVLISVRI